MSFFSPNKKRPIAEMNLTPLVDVTLVLLIIFMITAPMMFNGIQLQLPKTKKVHSLNLVQQQVVLSVSRTGEFYVNQQKLLWDELIPELNAKLKEGNQETLYLRADYGLQYGRVAKLMGHLKKGGIGNIALVTEIEEKDS
ncbi:MAG: ExbD/TolR family protein [Bacteriovoracia bacterium]